MSVEGVNKETWHYMLMLLGKPDVKVDTMISRFVGTRLAVQSDRNRRGSLSRFAKTYGVTATELDHDLGMAAEEALTEALLQPGLVTRGQVTGKSPIELCPFRLRLPGEPDRVDEGSLCLTIPAVPPWGPLRGVGPDGPGDVRLEVANRHDFGIRKLIGEFVRPIRSAFSTLPAACVRSRSGSSWSRFCKTILACTAFSQWPESQRWWASQ